MISVYFLCSAALMCCFAMAVVAFKAEKGARLFQLNWLGAV